MLRRTPPRAMFLALLFAGCANRGMEAPLEMDAFGGQGDLGGGGGVSAGGGGGGGRVGTGGTGTGGVATGGTGTGGVATGGMMGKGGSGGGAGATSTGGSSSGGSGGSAGAAGRGATGGAAGTGTGGMGTGGAAGGPGGRGGAAGGTAGAGGAAIPMFAYYPFDQTSGPTITDASGNGHNGTAQGTIAFAAGQIGNALNLNNGSSGMNYVSLPANLLQNVNDLTIAVWVFVRTDLSWARIFDFGSSTTKYMFLTSHAAGTGLNAVRFAITTGGNGPGMEQQLTGAAPLPTGTWTHVAVVLQGTSNGTLYVNGAAVASSTSIPLRPSSLGSMPNDWLGHSEFNDPYFDGELDDLRIYTRALTASDIQALYTER
ncbi:MAG TPA: LamG domain-containing protein [Polyangia bacterium]|nr:LamG domain-containing protein [Polyangia bacterium]